MRRREFLALMGAASLLEQAVAHRSLVSLTRVSANTRAGTWEFEHALHYHDAARVLRQLDGARQRQPDSAEGQARLLLEIERSFRWLPPDGRRLELTAVGGELRADSLWLYQECPAPLQTGRYSLRCELFHRIDPGWRHSVSLQVGSTTAQTLSLSPAQPEATFEVA